MFIKVNLRHPKTKIYAEQYLNSNLVLNVDPRGEIILASENTVTATPESAAYFLACVEAQAAHTTEAPEAPLLTTRIAQALRYDFPYGARIKYLIPLFPKNNTEEITAAISTLEAERVAVEVIPGYWYHAANITLPVLPAIKPNPDPSIEASDSNSNPADNTENS